MDKDDHSDSQNTLVTADAGLNESNKAAEAAAARVAYEEARAKVNRAQTKKDLEVARARHRRMDSGEVKTSINRSHPSEDDNMTEEGKHC